MIYLDHFHLDHDAAVNKPGLAHRQLPNGQWEFWSISTAEWWPNGPPQVDDVIVLYEDTWTEPFAGMEVQ